MSITQLLEKIAEAQTPYNRYVINDRAMPNIQNDAIFRSGTREDKQRMNANAVEYERRRSRGSLNGGIGMAQRREIIDRINARRELEREKQPPTSYEDWSQRIDKQRDAIAQRVAANKQKPSAPSIRPGTPPVKPETHADRVGERPTHFSSYSALAQHLNATDKSGRRYSGVQLQRMFGNRMIHKNTTFNAGELNARLSAGNTQLAQDNAVVSGLGRAARARPAVARAPGTGMPLPASAAPSGDFRRRAPIQPPAPRAVAARPAPAVPQPAPALAAPAQPAPSQSAVPAPSLPPPTQAGGRVRVTSPRV